MQGVSSQYDLKKIVKACKKVSGPLGCSSLPGFSISYHIVLVADGSLSNVTTVKASIFSDLFEP